MSPKLKAVIVESKTIPREFSLRAIKDGKQVPIQMVIKEAGFVPGDILNICLIEDDRTDEIAALENNIDDLEHQVRDLEDRIDRAARELDSY